MAGKNGNILIELRKGKKIKCPKCHIGNIIPYNTTADKAHSFNCSNDKCNWHLHCDPIIDIE